MALLASSRRPLGPEARWAEPWAVEATASCGREAKEAVMSTKLIGTAADTSIPTGCHRQASTRSTRRAPKTKKAQILALLRRKRGASMRDLTARTGWQAYSVRAALTGLRKHGTIIERQAEATGSRYRIIATQRRKPS